MGKDCEHTQDGRWDGVKAVDGGWWYVTFCPCGEIVRKIRRLTTDEVAKIPV